MMSIWRITLRSSISLVLFHGLSRCWGLRWCTGWQHLAAGQPMDRLVCGDVGFGKTEIAIRAAFKAACDSKQVAILVPTTVLSIQHYKNFKKRLEDFPVKVGLINRFITGKKQTETLKALEAGEIDIIIGTHKLVGQRVKFKDLGSILE